MGQPGFSPGEKLTREKFRPVTPRGYIHVLNHEQNCIKSDFKENSLTPATNG